MGPLQEAGRGRRVLGKHKSSQSQLFTAVINQPAAANGSKTMLTSYGGADGGAGYVFVHLVQHWMKKSLHPITMFCGTTQYI